ncbi:hypothetical protein U2071_15640, partial [Listeria monocytogenes]|uniref:hypothetical protein n=1 Tax=Listeria monocytogenes TaxID=1639 RepID=UPI002FDBB8E1
LLSENNIISNYAVFGFFIGILNAVLPMDKLKNLFLDRDGSDYQLSKPTFFEIKDRFETVNIF